MKAPQEKPKVLAPEAMAEGQGGTGVDAVSQAHTELARRAVGLIKKMADLYLRKMDAGMMTRDQLRIFANDEKQPAWKREAAQAALEYEPKK